MPVKMKFSPPGKICVCVCVPGGGGGGEEHNCIQSIVYAAFDIYPQIPIIILCSFYAMKAVCLELKKLVCRTKLFPICCGCLDKFDVIELYRS